LAEFVVGPCNRVAHAAALDVAARPGQEANPLVLHGPVGVGKTHLLEGIYTEIRRRHPSLRIEYLTAEGFTNRFLAAMRANQMPNFRRQLRTLDVLLLDDLQFLTKKTATQEEFVHTFDALRALDCQVVTTCDCHPRLADQLAHDLSDRLLGGASWSLSPPDATTRLDLLRAKSLSPGETPWPEEVVQYLADHLQGNVRELESAIHALRHWGRVAGRPIDLPLAREAVADLLRHAIRTLDLADVERAVCQALNLTPTDLQSKRRSWQATYPRMLAVYLARKHTTATYSEIGQRLGGRNHSTAVAAEKKVRQWLSDNMALNLSGREIPVRDLIERIERELLR
jgi:chromosomal replication initiator protein